MFENNDDFYFENIGLGSIRDSTGTLSKITDWDNYLKSPMKDTNSFNISSSSEKWKYSIEISCF